MISKTSQQISLLWVMRSNVNPRQGIKTHDHHYFTLLLVRRGELTINVNGDIRSLKQEETVLIPPHASHDYRNETDEYASCGEVKFHVLSQIMSEKLIAVPCYLGQNPFVKACIDEMLRTSSEYKEAEGPVLASYLETLIAHILDRYRSEQGESYGVVNTMHYSELTKQIVAYINHNYAKAISLDDIAESVGLNKNYICNAFKKDTGITIINCLTAVRIRKAAEMISYGECTLAQVAQQTGFINTSHFNRIFTKYTGISPGQYRRAYPVDILLDSVESHFSELDMDPEASRFIYSVLAHKKLTMEELRTKDIEDAKNEK